MVGGVIHDQGRVAAGRRVVGQAERSLDVADAVGAIANANGIAAATVYGCGNHGALDVEGVAARAAVDGYRGQVGPQIINRGRRQPGDGEEVEEGSVHGDRAAEGVSRIIDDQGNGRRQRRDGQWVANGHVAVNVSHAAGADLDHAAAVDLQGSGGAAHARYTAADVDHRNETVVAGGIDHREAVAGQVSLDGQAVDAGPIGDAGRRQPGDQSSCHGHGPAAGVRRVVDDQLGKPAALADRHRPEDVLHVALADVDQETAVDHERSGCAQHARDTAADIDGGGGRQEIVGGIGDGKVVAAAAAGNSQGSQIVLLEGNVRRRQPGDAAFRNRRRAATGIG